MAVLAAGQAICRNGVTLTHHLYRCASAMGWMSPCSMAGCSQASPSVTASAVVGAAGLPRFPPPASPARSFQMSASCVRCVMAATPCPSIAVAKSVAHSCGTLPRSAVTLITIFTSRTAPLGAAGAGNSTGCRSATALAPPASASGGETAKQVAEAAAAAAIVATPRPRRVWLRAGAAAAASSSCSRHVSGVGSGPDLSAKLLQSPPRECWRHQVAAGRLITT